MYNKNLTKKIVLDKLTEVFQNAVQAQKDDGTYVCLKIFYSGSSKYELFDAGDWVFKEN